MSFHDRLKALTGTRDDLTRLNLPAPAPAVKAADWWPDRSRGYSEPEARLASTRAALSYEDVDAMFSSAFVACLSTITRALPQAPLEVRRRLDDGTEEPIPHHPLVELYARPNPYHTSTQMWMALLTNYFVSGDAHQQIAANGYGVPAALYSRPFWAMRPVGTAEELIAYYEYTVNGMPSRVPREEVLHFRNGIDERPPSYGRNGVSPIEAVMGEIFTDDEAASLVSTVMHNGGVFTLYTPQGPLNISDVDADAFEARLNRVGQGARRGKAVLAQVQLEAKRVGMTPDELDYKAVRRLVEERVSAVMCVPAVRAGLGAGLDHSTFANYREAGTALWEECLIPLLSDFADVMTAFLLPRYGDANGLRVAFAFEKVAALQENRDAQFKRAIDAYDAGIVTRNEARSLIGVESQGEAGDVFKTRPGDVLVPWTADATQAQFMAQPGMSALAAARQRRQLAPMPAADEGAIDATGAVS